MTLRKNLIKARGEKTQSELASILGVGQQTYSHWERGRATPSVTKMVMLEKILGVPKERLFFDIFNSDFELKIPQHNYSEPGAPEGEANVAKTE